MQEVVTLDDAHVGSPVFTTDDIFLNRYDVLSNSGICSETRGQCKTVSSMRAKFTGKCICVAYIARTHSGLQRKTVLGGPWLLAGPFFFMCVYVCMYIHTHTHIYTYTYTCTHACTCMRIHAHTSILLQVSKCLCIPMYVDKRDTRLTCCKDMHQNTNFQARYTRALTCYQVRLLFWEMVVGGPPRSLPPSPSYFAPHLRR
jgi:hypothetical protein